MFTTTPSQCYRILINASILLANTQKSQQQIMTEVWKSGNRFSAFDVKLFHFKLHFAQNTCVCMYTDVYPSTRYPFYAQNTGTDLYSLLLNYSGIPSNFTFCLFRLFFFVAQLHFHFSLKLLFQKHAQCKNKCHVLLPISSSCTFNMFPSKAFVAQK